MRADPVEKGADVLHRVLAQHAVVELEEGLAEAIRAAHVGKDHRHAELGNEIVVAADEAGARLRLRPAVDVHDHRALAGEALRRMVVEAGDLAAVEALPFREPRLDELAGVHFGVVAVGPARHLPRLEVHGEDVARGACRGDVEADFL